MRHILFLLTIALLLFNPILDVTLAQDKKPPRSFTDSDVDPSVKKKAEDRKKEEAAAKEEASKDPKDKDTPKDGAKPTAIKPGTSPLPTKPSDTTTPSGSPTPNDPFANLPQWAKVQKATIDAYYTSQLNGQPPNPFFCGGDVVSSQVFPINMKGLYSYKIIKFQGDAESATWVVVVNAPPGRSSTMGRWVMVLKTTPGDEIGTAYCITRMGRSTTSISETP
jgi:hypothetical protein